jgi:hypothetical protein
MFTLCILFIIEQKTNRQTNKQTKTKIKTKTKQNRNKANKQTKNAHTLKRCLAIL